MRTILVRAKKSVGIVSFTAWFVSKTRTQQRVSFRENTVMPMSSLIFHALWLSCGTRVQVCKRKVGIGLKIFVKISNAFDSFQLNLVKCDVHFVHQNFDKSQFCIVIYYKASSYVFKMVK